MRKQSREETIKIIKSRFTVAQLKAKQTELEGLNSAKYMHILYDIETAIATY